MPSPLPIDDFSGFSARIATVWSELRPSTRGLVERALRARCARRPGDAKLSIRRPCRYRAKPLPRRARRACRGKERGSDAETGGRLKSIAETCATVLQEKTESAEVFAQLVRRASNHRDYKRIDRLADALNTRFPPSEICELARSGDKIARELANEALARCPISVLTGLLNDPVDADTARSALRRQVVEYGSGRSAANRDRTRRGRVLIFRSAAKPRRHIGRRSRELMF